MVLLGVFGCPACSFLPLDKTFVEWGFSFISRRKKNGEYRNVCHMMDRLFFVS